MGFVAVLDNRVRDTVEKASVLFAALAHACTAVPTTTGAQRISLVISVPFRAMRDLGGAVLRVGLRRDCSQMQGIYAEAHSANVVNLETGGNWANPMLVGPTVSTHALAFDGELAVSTIATASPHPTSRLLHFGGESFFISQLRLERCSAGSPLPHSDLRVAPLTERLTPDGASTVDALHGAILHDTTEGV